VAPATREPDIRAQRPGHTGRAARAHTNTHAGRLMGAHNGKLARRRFGLLAQIGADLDPSFAALTLLAHKTNSNPKSVIHSHFERRRASSGRELSLA